MYKTVQCFINRIGIICCQSLLRKSWGLNAIQSKFFKKIKRENPHLFEQILTCLLISLKMLLVCINTEILRYSKLSTIYYVKK